MEELHYQSHGAVMCDAVFAEVNFVFAGQPADGGVEVGYGEAGGLLQFLHLPYVLVLVGVQYVPNDAGVEADLILVHKCINYLVVMFSVAKKGTLGDIFTFCCVLNVFHFTFFIIWPGWTFILSGLAEPWKTDISEF